ncbi:MAG: BNR-4 repeat-containing protein [Kiritimatiellae bacterium]|nr:BNR-4 repeat-containing protein [Kiritimatiellia bacterium]
MISTHTGKQFLITIFITFTCLAASWMLPGAEVISTWWERETIMTDDSSLSMAQKSWWTKVKALKSGEHFMVRSEYPGGGLMLVRCETLTRRGSKKPQDAIVWIIDDDGDMKSDGTNCDKDSDCYVVDYDQDGLADRMVDYIDNNSDNQADEMEIRYFPGGQLQNAWFAQNLSGDGKMWDLRSYEYSGNFFRCNPYGNNMIYANQYDPEQKRWWPISECPFAFYDTDGNGRADAVVRVSAVPLSFDPLNEPDLGNSLFGQRFTSRLRENGAMNVRYSLDLDGQSTAERPLHYDCGFNLIGRVPYKFPGMARENRLRRVPKTTYTIPHGDAIRFAETYPAEQTGFSWREYKDALLKIGDVPHQDECRRWEGIFWTWSRRIMHDTGAPIQDLNTRREFQDASSTRRELYYSRVDHRIHLKGAREGWTMIGHLGGTNRWGEIRMFDINGDGYFDRWEVYRTGDAAPVRVSTVTDTGVRSLPQEWDKLRQLYVKELLPKALAANRELMDAMRLAVDYQPSADLAKALEACTCDSERQFIQDIIREEQYLALREKLLQQSAKLLTSGGKSTLRSKDGMVASGKAWEYATALVRLDTAYAEGRYEDAATVIRELMKSGDSFQGIWYECGKTNTYPGQPSVYSGPMATYSAWHRPMAVHVVSQAKTYFVFGNTQNAPAISYYDHRRKQFVAPVVLGSNPDGDAHRNPTLLVDEQGYLYVFYGAHGHPTHVVKSVEPYRIDQWRKMVDIDDPKTSYPQPWQLRGGELFVSFRLPPQGWCFRRSTDGAQSWEPAKVLIQFAGHAIYAITVAENGSYPRKVHITWSRLGGGTPGEIATKHLWARRYNVYYAYSDDTGVTWKRSDGTPYKLPIDEEHAEKLYDSGEHGVWLKDIQLDPQGRPLILFIDSECKTFTGKWKVARQQTGCWQIADFAQSDHMYDDGALVIRGEKDYGIYAPTGVSQPHEDGGEIEEWQSTDGGATWARIRALTIKSQFSHNNVKAVLGGAPEFRVFWSYGDSVSPPRNRAVDMFCFGESLTQPRQITIGSIP